MFYRTRLLPALATVLACIVATACSGAAGVEPTMMVEPSPAATEPEPTPTAQPEPTPTEESPPPTSQPEPTPAEGTSTVLAQGTFEGADAAHQGSGSAKIVRREDGDLVLELEDFSVTEGPDLYVYLSSSAAPPLDGGFVVVGTEGNVYISDSYNNRVQAFDPQEWRRPAGRSESAVTRCGR